jgi:exodeoxyribonuclease-3
MKILSWNVNGVRAAVKSGLLDWLESEKPDLLCLQETKCREDQLDAATLAPLGYQTFWHSAKKAGYSGVAFYVRTGGAVGLTDVKNGIGDGSVDDEGRVITAHFGPLAVVNAYFPNSQREHQRLAYKLEFCDKIQAFAEGLVKSGNQVVLCGDYNIAHQAIDLRNPKANENNAGYLPEERHWMSKFLGAGFIDSFRHLVSEPGHYTWWSYRPGVRENNIGWRIDYHCINKACLPLLTDAWIMPQVRGSDHCPVGIALDL